MQDEEPAVCWPDRLPEEVLVLILLRAGLRSDLRWSAASCATHQMALPNDDLWQRLHAGRPSGVVAGPDSSPDAAAAALSQHQLAVRDEKQRVAKD